MDDCQSGLFKTNQEGTRHPGRRERPLPPYLKFASAHLPCCLQITNVLFFENLALSVWVIAFTLLGMHQIFFLILFHFESPERFQVRSCQLHLHKGWHFYFYANTRIQGQKLQWNRSLIGDQCFEISIFDLVLSFFIWFSSSKEFTNMFSKFLWNIFMAYLV